MVYARKIAEDAWFYKPSLDADSISDLRTTEHELSVWKIEDPSNQQQLDDIALALALSRNAVDELFMVLIDPSKLEKEYKWVMDYKEQIGDTGFVEMAKEHTNFLLLTFWHQGFLAEHINNLIADSSNYRYYDVSTLLDLLKTAVGNGRIKSEVLKEKCGRWNKELNAIVSKSQEKQSSSTEQ